MSGPNPDAELPTSFYRALILDRVCDYIQGRIPLDFVSTRVVRKEYWPALYEHLTKFETKDFPLRIFTGVTAKKCRYDWRLPDSPKHAAFLQASGLDNNRNTRAAMQLLPVLFARELAACDNKWPEALYQAEQAEQGDAGTRAICPVRAASDDESEEEVEQEEAAEQEEEQEESDEEQEAAHDLSEDETSSSCSSSSSVSSVDFEDWEDRRLKALNYELTKTWRVLERAGKKVDKAIEKKCLARVKYAKLLAKQKARRSQLGLP